MTDAIDLTTEQRTTLSALLRRFLPGVAVWAYGSRVKWTARPNSDLDLVAFTTPAQRAQVTDLKEALAESTLPFPVDLHVWDDVPERFREIIGKEYVVVQEAKESDEKKDLSDKWRLIAFGQLLAEPVRNGIYKQKEFHGRGAKIVNMGELFAHPRLGAVPMKRVELSDSESSRFTLEKGDLLFARRSLVAEGAGKCSLVLDINEPTTFESSIIRARPDCTKADSLFLYYFFNSRPGLHCLDTIRRQVAVAGITGSDLAKLEITLPSLSEQRAIAHILGTLDDKIELNRRMNETLEAMARALFKSWFVDFDPVRAKAEGRDTGLPTHLADLFPDSFEDSELGEIPRGWQVKPLSDLTSYFSRGIGPSYIDEGGVCVLNQKCIRDRRVNFSESRRHDSTKRPIEGRELRALDILVNSTGIGTLGRVAQVWYLPETAIVDSHVTVVRAANDVDPWFFGVALLYRETEIEELGEGSTGQTELSRARLGALTCLVPSVCLQVAFGKIASQLLLRIAENGRESLVLEAVCDTLLPKLISGELRVKDSEKFVEKVV